MRCRFESGTAYSKDPIMPNDLPHHRLAADSTVDSVAGEPTEAWANADGVTMLSQCPQIGFAPTPKDFWGQKLDSLPRSDKLGRAAIIIMGNEVVAARIAQPVNIRAIPEETEET
jgi:hypothetical protein